MGDEAREQAWRKFCEQLEPLGVDPYSPEIPPDDHRYSRVQDAIAERDAALGKTASTPLPPGWEGTPPLLELHRLVDVDEWLKDQWSSIIAEEMGGGNGPAMALDRAVKTVRDAFRVFKSLGLDELPKRPVPPLSLNDAKSHVLALERWVSEKAREGWGPKERAPLTEPPSLATTPSRRRKRAELPDDEIELHVKRILVRDRDTPIRDVSDEIGVSVGKIQKTEAWQQNMTQRRADRKPSQKAPRRLTKAMMEAVGREDDPAAKIDAQDALFRWLLERSKPEERARLHAMTSAERAELAETMRDQFMDDMGKDALDDLDDGS